MPSRRKILDSRLSTEDRQWLRDLPLHRGFQLLTLAVQELLAQDLQELTTSGDLEVVLRAQGAYNRGTKVLNLPALLQEVDPTLPSGGMP